MAQQASNQIATGRCEDEARRACGIGKVEVEVVTDGTLERAEVKVKFVMPAKAGIQRNRGVRREYAEDAENRTLCGLCASPRPLR